LWPPGGLFLVGGGGLVGLVGEAEQQEGGIRFFLLICFWILMVELREQQQ
jgi:hypothetical protein